MNSSSRCKTKQLKSRNNQFDMNLMKFTIVVATWFLLAVASYCDELVFEYHTLPYERCRLDRYSDRFDLKAHLSRTVLEATALEKFKYYAKRTPGANGPKKLNQNVNVNVKSYSILFQIKRIYKYENAPFLPQALNGRAARNESASANYFYISSQDEHSSDVNLNSFFLVENFHSSNTTISGVSLDSTNENDQCAKVDIVLNKNYFLFIDGQDLTIDLNARRVFTYPIRVNSLLNSSNKHLNNQFVKSYRRDRYQRANQNNRVFSWSAAKGLTTTAKSRLALFVKMPIFNLTSTPILADDNKKFLHDTISQIVCHNCATRPTVIMRTSLNIASINDTVNLECNYYGNPIPKVYWRRYTNYAHETIQNDNKFNIISRNNSISVLTINRVGLDDDGYYYCMARDFVKGDEFNEVIVKDRTKLIVKNQRHLTSPNALSTSTRLSLNSNKMKETILNVKLPTYKDNRNSSIFRPYRKKPTKKPDYDSSLKLKTVVNSSSRRINNNNNKHYKKYKSLRRNHTANYVHHHHHYHHAKKPNNGEIIFSSQTNDPKLSSPSTFTSRTITRTTTTTSTVTRTLPTTVTYVPTVSVDDKLAPRRERNYVLCKSIDNTCLNGGICYVTNPLLYSDVDVYNQIKIKFCICKEFFEGPNCEITLMKSIIYDPDEIPDDLKALWDSLSNRSK